MKNTWCKLIEDAAHRLFLAVYIDKQCVSLSESSNEYAARAGLDFWGISVGYIKARKSARDTAALTAHVEQLQNGCAVECSFGGLPLVRAEQYAGTLIGYALAAAGCVAGRSYFALRAAALDIKEKYGERAQAVFRQQTRGIVMLSLVEIVDKAMRALERKARSIAKERGALTYADAARVAEIVNKIYAAIIGDAGNVTATFLRRVDDVTWRECPPSIAEVVELRAHDVSMNIPGTGERNAIAATLGATLLDCIAEICNLTEQPNFDFSDNKDEIERYDIKRN